MREIKFRGYNKQKGWLYGLLWRHILGGYAIENYDNSLECYDVEEASIGQYTGLKDENDKEIYEGDILNWDVDAYGYVKMINGSWRICPSFLTMEDYYIGKLAEKAKVVGNIYEEKLKENKLNVA